MNTPAPKATSNVRTDSDITKTEFNHVWRDEQGALHSTVRLGHATLYFGEPETARALAAACIAAAEAMETFPPAETETTGGAE